MSNLSQKPYDSTEKFGFTLISTSLDCLVLSKYCKFQCEVSNFVLSLYIFHVQLVRKHKND